VRSAVYQTHDKLGVRLVFLQMERGF